MKRFFTIVALVFATGQALALTQGSPPPAFPIVWGQNAGSSYIRSIPVPSQIGTQNCAASLTDGMPPLTFVPSVAGGCPPFGQDFNGIFKQLSQWSQWQKAGGPVFYDSAFASGGNGGYPNGAIVMSAVVPGDHWMSTADNNTTNPDAGGANWVQAPGEIPIGTPVQSIIATVPTGYVSANGKTIGNGSSNGTQRSNADTQFLFSLLWSGCASCQLYNSAGTPISRGATAAADFAANDAIATTNLNGKGLMGADSQNSSTSSNLTGVPVTSGNTTTPGSIVGENLHALVTGELAAHTHSITDPGHTHTITDPGHHHTFGALQNVGGNVVASGGAAPVATQTHNTSTSTTGITATNSSTTGITATNSTGSGTGHNTVELSALVWWNLKL